MTIKQTIKQSRLKADSILKRLIMIKVKLIEVNGSGKISFEELDRDLDYINERIRMYKEWRKDMGIGLTYSEIEYLNKIYEKIK